MMFINYCDHQFDLMYAKCTCVHRRAGKGMKEDESSDAHENLTSLEKDYERLELRVMKGHEH
jgi:hypothetical protein